MSLLAPDFFARDATSLAQALIGVELVRGEVRLRITETEAYPPGDSASHCRAGRTARNAPMWGPPGHAYVYICYGIHQMLNVVSGAEGSGEAVLVRAAEPLDGLDTIRARRGAKSGPVLLTGPGKVGAALALDGAFNAHALFEPGGLEAHARDVDLRVRVLAGPRVGIDFASPRDVRARRRFALAGTPWVSHPKTLSRLRRR